MLVFHQSVWSLTVITQAAHFNMKKEQAGAELGQAQLKLELELGFT